jgi:hypothetical protein
VPTALFFSQSRIIVGAAGSEAARAALAVGDFDTVYQHIAVFDQLRMVAATVGARGLSPPDKLHVRDRMRRSDHGVGLEVNRAAPEERAGAARSTSQTRTGRIGCRLRR